MFLKRRRAVGTAVAAAACAVSLWSAATAGADLYYLDVQTGFIARANQTGQTADSTVAPVGRTIGPCCTHRPGGFGLATDGPHLYWTNADGDQGNSSTLGRATLDENGEVVEGSVTQTFVDLPDVPLGLAITMQPDGTAYLYWANQKEATGTTGEGIGRLKVDGQGDVVPGSVTPDFITGAADPLYVATNGNDIYWGNQATNSIGHARVDENGDLAGTPNPLAIPSNDIPTDPLHEPDVYRPSGLAFGGGYLYWGNDKWRSFGSFNNERDGHEIGRVAIGADGLPSAAVENKWITGSGSAGQAFTGTQTPNGLATDGSHVYWGNGGIPWFSSKDDDIGRAPIVDPMGPGFSYSWVSTNFTTSIVALRDAVVGVDCPTSKEPVVTCTATVSNLQPLNPEVPQGHVVFNASGTGTFDPAEGECLLSAASASTATCTIDYVRQGDGGERIDALYTGGPRFSLAEGTTALLPKVKDTPPDDGTPILPGVTPQPGSDPGQKSKCKKKKKKGKKKKCKKGKKKKKS